MQHSKFPLYEHPCGMCRECQQGPRGPIVVTRTPEGAPTSVDVLCYEPSEVHVARLTHTRDLLYGVPSMGSRQDGKPKVNFNVLHAAVSNSTGIARFPRNCTANMCSLSDEAAAPVEVVLTTVDTQMEVRGLTRIDVLKIDTEGHDPAVLAGAYKALSERRVNALSFEYHSLWERTNTTLRQCLDYLETFGYSCYYDGDIVAKLTGCWVPQYELRRWMNVVCAITDGPLDKALTQRSWFRLQG